MNEDQKYRMAAKRDVDPKDDNRDWMRAAVYVTLVLGRIGRLGPWR